jgi:glycosyltransferase involved in cell wall biosynthesis
MKLLMISGDRALAQGKQGAFYNTLSELHTHFDRIDVICPRVSVNRYGMVVFGNVHVHPSPWPLIFQPLWIFWQGWKLVRQEGHEVMVVNNYPPFYMGVAAAALARRFRLPYLLEIFHIEGYPRAANVRQRVWRWWTGAFFRYTARPATAVRVMNGHQVPEFLIRHGVPVAKIQLIPAVYLDLTVFRPLDTPKQYDIAFVGRMTSNKGLNIFLDVLERTGLVGVAVGEGPLLPWVRRQAKRRGLKLHTPGFARDTEEIVQYLNASKLLLMTSLNEGGPRVVAEALACGVPVVATPVGIVPDILPPECIEEWNAGDLADKVRNILSDEVLYARLRESGPLVVRQFERSAAIQKYADAIKSLVHE